MFETIDLEIDHRGVATLSLNRPDKGNAINGRMRVELHEAFARLAQDAGVRMLILRGKGKHFCAGADLGGRGDAPASVTLADMLRALDVFPKPTICVVQRGCVGGGLALAACCDVVLAYEEAFFSVPEVRIGIAPSFALSQYFMRALGSRALRRYGLSGERIESQTALRLGLAHEVVAEEAAESRLEAMVDEFMHAAPEAGALLKSRIAHLASGAPEPDASGEPRGLGRSAESIEGVAAYREKRKPSWYKPS